MLTEMETSENFQSQLNTLITKTIEAEEDMEENLDFFLNDDASLKKIENVEKRKKLM